RPCAVAAHGSRALFLPREETAHGRGEKGRGDIADALYYNPSLTLNILHKLGVAVQFFNLWFQMLQEVKKSGTRANFKREHDKKVCCLGLTSLLGLPADQLPGEAFERVFKATLELLVSYKDQVAETKKQADAVDDIDGFEDDDDEDEEEESDKEMGDDSEDGDEADSLKIQKLAAENLTQTLDFRYQAMASGIAQHAEQRRVEIEKEKLEQAVGK
ncbi:hypothetical protein BHE74_00037166, partial [Ensete ventricosum]